MEEIERIARTIASVMKIKVEDIKKSKGVKGQFARQMLCRIALKDNVYMSLPLSTYLDLHRNSCTTLAYACEGQLIDGDITYLKWMNAVRAKLGLRKLYESRMPKESESAKARRKEKSRQIAKRIFNIEYTDEDEAMIKAAIIGANRFMRDYCRSTDKKSYFPY